MECTQVLVPSPEERFERNWLEAGAGWKEEEKEQKVEKCTATQPGLNSAEVASNLRFFCLQTVLDGEAWFREP